MARSIVAQPPLFSTINVTPFIDVLLVLLIMLIMTIPVATHKLPLDLPSGPSAAPAPADPHTLAIDAGGRLGWDGRAIADAELAPLLAATAQADAPLILDPEAQARYERVDQVLARVRRAGVTRLGFVGRFRLPD